MDFIKRVRHRSKYYGARMQNPAYRRPGRRLRNIAGRKLCSTGMGKPFSKAEYRAMMKERAREILERRVIFDQGCNGVSRTRKVRIEPMNRGRERGLVGRRQVDLPF